MRNSNNQYSLHGQAKHTFRKYETEATTRSWYVFKRVLNATTSYTQLEKIQMLSSAEVCDDIEGDCAPVR